MGQNRRSSGGAHDGATIHDGAVCAGSYQLPTLSLSTTGTNVDACRKSLRSSIYGTYSEMRSVSTTSMEDFNAVD